MLTLFSMLKIWGGVFWGERDEEPAKAPREHDRLGAPVWMIVPTAALLVATVAFSVWAGPLYDIAERAGADLLDPAGYVEAVLGGEAVTRERAMKTHPRVGHPHLAGRALGAAVGRRERCERALGRPDRGAGAGVRQAPSASTSTPTPSTWHASTCR
jgi:hypothetical protein